MGFKMDLKIVLVSTLWAMYENTQEQWLAVPNIPQLFLLSLSVGKLHVWIQLGLIFLPQEEH
jgi:hypothetical protein